MRTAIASVMAVQMAALVVPAAAQEPRAYDVTVTRQVVDGRPARVETAMPPDTGEIFVWFRFQGVAPGAQLSASWRYLGGAAPFTIGQSSVVVAAGPDWTNFSMQLEPGKTWPEGPYRVDLLVADRLIGGAPFTIVRGSAIAPATRPSDIAPAPSTAVPPPADTRRYVHPRAGYALTPPEGWTVDDSMGGAGLQMKASGGAGLVEITVGPTSERLDPASYAAGWESMAVGPGRLLLMKRQGRRSTVDFEAAYQAVYHGNGVQTKVVFVATPARMFVITGVFSTDDFAAGEVIFDKLMQDVRLPAR